MCKHCEVGAGESHLEFTDRDRGEDGLVEPTQENRGKENKCNPADKSWIVSQFIWTHGAEPRLNPNETAACPEWIHHRWIGVITFRRAPLLLIRLLSGHSLSAAVHL